MKVENLAIPGVVLLRSDVHVDERGSFRRIADLDEMQSLGFDNRVVQISAARNTLRGTVRGLHYQVAPDEESKTIWCSAGRVYDVVVDLRSQSQTYGRWISIELAADEPAALCIPPGIGHGYQTLEDDSELTYLISTPFAPASARSLLWCDTELKIDWPLPVAVMSDRDREAPPWPPEHL